MSCWDGFAPPPWDAGDEGWHDSDDEEWQAWKAEGMADAEDWFPNSWRDGWPPTPEEEMFRKTLEQGELDGGS
jgi:hypothetical protein